MDALYGAPIGLFGQKTVECRADLCRVAEGSDVFGCRLRDLLVGDHGVVHGSLQLCPACDKAEINLLIKDGLIPVEQEDHHAEQSPTQNDGDGHRHIAAVLFQKRFHQVTPAFLRDQSVS